MPRYTGRRRHGRRYQRQHSRGPVGNWKGVFAGRSPNPDTLYTKVMQEFTSDELWGAVPPGNVYVNSGFKFQNNPTSTANAHPHAICVNSPILQIMYPESVPTFRQRAVGWIDVNKWASFYEYCTIYETDIILNIGQIFSLDAGYNPYGTGEDAVYIYYCLPNVDIPPATAGVAYNPWGLQTQTTPVSTVMRTPKILRKRLNFPNTAGRSSGCTLRIKWKLKDIGDAPMNYMEKSVSANFNGTGWSEPVDRTGFDTALGTKRHFFYFWLGTDNGNSQWNYQAKWTCKLYAKAKFWQPRSSILAPVLNFKTGEQEREELEQGPVPDEDWVDDMDIEGSVPSTPIINQLAQELKNLNAKKKV